MASRSPARVALQVLGAEAVAAGVAVAVLSGGEASGTSDLGVRVGLLVAAVCAAAIIYIVAVVVLLRRAGATGSSSELLAIAPHSFVACLVAVAAVPPVAFLCSAAVAPVLVWWRGATAPGIRDGGR